ncbi:hypothetical protein ASD24_29630 [Paenibacillus sp. Root52]|uniref:hypothetical protein n=1 Tax=Paenibacillus sp. Root52 TaxID=1736552 RepID=UPI0006FB973E|nr:hypothetical protein [Paenibacillus sp. Root52]KQY83679.1 hypothetical protein ASD24_29630 [Paenibacillus sp. Root52]
MGSIPERKPGGLIGFAEQQQLIAQFPLIIKNMHKQTALFQQVMKGQMNISVNQLNAINKQINLSERLLHKVDELARETKITNILLADLIAIHRTVVADDTDGQRDYILATAQRGIEKEK